MRKTRSGISRDYRGPIVFEKLRFQNVFRPYENETQAISNSSGLKSVFEKLRFRDGLVWTVGLTIEIKLRFQISLSYCGRCLRSKHWKWRLVFFAVDLKWSRKECLYGTIIYESKCEITASLRFSTGLHVNVVIKVRSFIFLDDELFIRSLFDVLPILQLTNIFSFLTITYSTIRSAHIRVTKFRT